MAAKVDLSWLVTWLQNWISFGIIYFDLKENLFLWKIVDRGDLRIIIVM